MKIEEIFKEKEINDNNTRYYENNYIPIVTIYNVKEALEILCERFEKVIQHRLETINSFLKVSLDVYQAFSYKDNFIIDNNDDDNETKSDTFCITTGPQQVGQNSNVKSLVKKLIDNYDYNLPRKIQEQYDKCQINFLNIELIKIQFFKIY